MTKPFKLSVPIYGGEVWRFHDYASYAASAKRMLPGEEITDDNRTLGETLGVSCPDGSLRCLVFWKLDAEDAVKVHECVHIAMEILKYVHIDPTSSDGEPMAYLTDWLYDQLA